MSDEEGQAFGFSIPIPPELFERREQARMRGEARTREIWAFIDGLSNEQLITLRYLLNAKGRMLNYLDGQVVSILRLVRNVDPDSGLTEIEMLQRADDAAKSE